MILAIPPGWSTPIGWVAPYHIAMLVGMLTGAAIFLWQMTRIGVRPGRVFASLPLAVVLPVACARIVDMLVYSWDQLLRTPFDVLRVLGGGLSSHGAVLGLFLLALVLGRFYRVEASRITDRLVPWGLVGIVAARVGDYVHNQGVGTPLEALWAIGYVRMPDHGEIARHPTNFYEIAIVLVLLLVFFVLLRKTGNRRPGIAAAVVTGVYFLSRIFIDGVREVPLIVDSPRFATGQLLSLLAVVALVPVVVLLVRRGEVEPPGPPTDETGGPRGQSGAGIRVSVGSALIAMMIAAIVGSISEVLAFHVKFTQGELLSPLTVGLWAAVIWAIPVLLFGWVGGRLGDLLASWKARAPRMALAIPLLVISLVVTVAGMTTLPMAFTAVLVVFFAVAMPSFHTIRDMVVYLVGGSLAVVAHVILSRVVEDSNRVFNLIPVFILFGIASVITDRTRIRVASMLARRGTG